RQPAPPFARVRRGAGAEAAQSLHARGRLARRRRPGALPLPGPRHSARAHARQASERSHGVVLWRNAVRLQFRDRLGRASDRRCLLGSAHLSRRERMGAPSGAPAGGNGAAGLVAAGGARRMRMRQVLISLAVVLVLALGSDANAASGEPVDLQLVLAADVSRSIDNDEFELQRQGYVAALQDPRVVSAIQGGSIGAIAITYIEWASIGEQKIVVDWTVVRDGEGAGIVADQIRKAPRSFFGHTSI